MGSWNWKKKNERLTIEIKLHAGDDRVLLLSIVMSIGIEAKMGRWRGVARTKIVWRLATQNSVQVVTLKLRDDQNILDDVLRRANEGVVH